MTSTTLALRYYTERIKNQILTPTWIYTSSTPKGSNGFLDKWLALNGTYSASMNRLSLRTQIASVVSSSRSTTMTSTTDGFLLELLHRTDWRICLAKYGSWTKDTASAGTSLTFETSTSTALGSGDTPTSRWRGPPKR